MIWPFLQCPGLALATKRTTSPRLSFDILLGDFRGVHRAYAFVMAEELRPVVLTINIRHWPTAHLDAWSLVVTFYPYNNSAILIKYIRTLVLRLDPSPEMSLSLFWKQSFLPDLPYLDRRMEIYLTCRHLRFLETYGIWCQRCTHLTTMPTIAISLPLMEVSLPLDRIFGPVACDPRPIWTFGHTNTNETSSTHTLIANPSFSICVEFFFRLHLGTRGVSDRAFSPVHEYMAETSPWGPGPDLGMGKLRSCQGPPQPEGLHIFHEKKNCKEKMYLWVTEW